MATSQPEEEYERLKVTPEMEEKAKQEQQNELVALNDIDGHWTLQVGAGYEREWQKIERALRSAQKNDSNDSADTPDSYNDSVFTISFLGNTSAGKSFVTKYLLERIQKEKCSNTPIIIDVMTKCGATTANINFYSCEFRPDQKILLLDYEGEKGPGFPLMYRAQAHLAHISRRADKASQRRKAVTDYFPKLAYMLSDIIILVGTEDLASTDYLTRFEEFVTKANENVDQIVSQPMLIIIQNKTSMTQAQLSRKEVTDCFFAEHGNAAKVLKKYFSEIYCVYLPFRNLLERINDNVVLNGLELFNQQLDKLIDVFKEQSEKHLEGQPLLYPQWLYLLKKLLPSVQSGKIISLHTLLSEITQIDSDPIIEMARLCFIRAYGSESVHSPEWFDKCCQFAVNILIYLLALEIPSGSEVMFQHYIDDVRKKTLQRLSERLLEFQPCEALYTGVGRLTRDGTDTTQIYCYQHRGAHGHGHRTYQPLYNLTRWKSWRGQSSFDVWNGAFISSRETTFSEKLVKSLPRLVKGHIAALQRKEDACYTEFIDLLVNHKFQNKGKFFAAMCFCKDPISSSTVFRSSNAQNEHRAPTSNLQRFFIYLRNLILRPDAPTKVIHTKCNKCYQKLDELWQNRPINNSTSATNEH